MNSYCSIFAISFVLCALLVGADNDGKYRASRYNQNADLRYVSGKYIPMNDRAYMHVHDMRELGRYIHIPFPYMGGYGPYSHMPNPYLHQFDDRYPYEHVSSSSEYHPFNVDGYDIPKPSIPLEYGFPNIPASPQSSPIQTVITTNDFPTTTTISTTDTPIIDSGDSTTILTGDNLIVRKKRSLFHSQPKSIEITTTTPRPTTTQRPRVRYDDEGKWRIIRQEETKEPKKYDYFFETENKIFAQEAGKVSGKDKSNEGTNGVGWYQYVGDDNKVYRVEYETGTQGFIPKGDHIHKAIQKHLNSLKERYLI